MEGTDIYPKDYTAPTDKDSLITRIKDIFSQGWIDLTRGGPTGPGKTWEDHLGISENNLRLPDIGSIEIKVLAEKKSSALTLVSRALPYEKLLSYGVAKTTVVKSGLFKTRRDRVTGELIQLGKIYYKVNKSVRAIDWYLKPSGAQRRRHILLERWSVDELFAKTSWLCVTFYNKRLGGIGYGQMFPTRCYLFRLPVTKLLELLKQGQVYYEQRAHLKPYGGIRDHGSAWRMSRRGIGELIGNKEPVVAAKINY